MLPGKPHGLGYLRIGGDRAEGYSSDCLVMPETTRRCETGASAGKVEAEYLGGGLVLDRHLVGTGLAKTYTVAVAVSGELKHIAGDGDGIEVAANSIPAQSAVDAKAQAARGDRYSACGAEYFKLRSPTRSVLGDADVR